MKALVTGGCGFIGSQVVDALIKRGDSVTVIDSETADNDVFYKNTDATYLKENILDFDFVRRVCADRDLVFHLAAESRIGPAIENPRKATEVNVIGTCNVLQAARDAKVKGFVYSSTSACYGLKNTVPMHEDMPFDNLNPYSTSKIAGEDLTLMFAKLYGLPSIALRYFNVFGDRMPSRGQYAPVLAIFLRQVKSGELPTVVGDGEQRRDFVHINDIVQANLLAAGAAAKYAGRVYNVGSGRNVSVLELAKLFGRKINHLPPRSGEARTTLASLERIKADLGYQPTVEVVQWLSEEIKRQGLAA